MTLLDVQELARPGSWAPSPNGQWMLYTISTPDWQEDTSQFDIHLVSMSEGLASGRQMTFTSDKNERSPRWSRDGTFFVFASDRDVPATESINQLYLMLPDGGEARQITNVEHGVADFAFSFDGAWLAYRSGEAGGEQLYRLPVDNLFSANADQITDEVAGIEAWAWARDSRSVYFVRPNSRDEDDVRRLEENFTVDIKNAVTPLSNLWVAALAVQTARQLTDLSNASVTDFDLSSGGRWVTFVGGSAERYERNITSSRL